MAGGARDIGYAVRRDRSAYVRILVIRPAAEADDTLRIRHRHSTGLGGILGSRRHCPGTLYMAYRFESSRRPGVTGQTVDNTIVRIPR